MNYHVRRQGEDLGVFPLDELRRRRESGEFNGAEYVQGKGMPDWQPLDLVLQHGRQLAPPPLPPSVFRKETNLSLIWAGIAGGAVLCICLVVGFGMIMQRSFLRTANQIRANNLSRYNPGAVAIASRPIVFDKNTQTFADEQKRQREFRIRQWVDGYEKNGRRDPQCDAEADLFLRTFVARNYGGPEATNSISLEDESDKLANDPNCTDPLVLTIAADESLNLFDSIHRYERALAAYPNSSHKAYPKLYAMVKLAGQLGGNSDRAGELQTSGLEQLKQCFADGSFTPGDQQEIADIFVNGWGYNFFAQNAESVCSIVQDAGPDYKWLSQVLDGEHEIILAWAARGGGYADSVSSAGWQGFSVHLANARTDLTAAWNMQPAWPLAPERMIYVSLGDSDLNEMRLWFDRTTTAQIDYSRAWSDFRWGLRPRWYGNEEAMLALGVAAVNTGRFDTDVPRKYFDCIGDVESEMELPAGKHIYSRDDIWPNLQRMYEGYVNAPSQEQYQQGWRESYAIVAYFAGKYDIARTQLEALNWKPSPGSLQGWRTDLSLMPLEVAARTGPLAAKIDTAENSRNNGQLSQAIERYSVLTNDPNADDRTKDFIDHRLAELTAEKRLQDGEWISLLPSRDDDPNWVVSFGKTKVLPDGALEVESGPQGHMLFSRVRAGMNFEVRGQFELVHSANANFQGGLVMGVPDFNSYDWYGFRLKRHGEEGDVVCFAEGWTRDQIVQHIVLNDVTNSFDFTFQDGRVTASVNGLNVFNGAAPPVSISVPDDSYLVGLGAFNDSSDTVIRYRNVQLRSL